MQTRKNSLRRFSLFAILLLLLASCAPKLTFVVSRPSQLPIKNVKSVSMGKFDNQQGQMIALPTLPKDKKWEAKGTIVPTVNKFTANGEAANILRGVLVAGLSKSGEYRLLNTSGENSGFTGVIPDPTSTGVLHAKVKYYEFTKEGLEKPLYMVLAKNKYIPKSLNWKQKIGLKIAFAGGEALYRATMKKGFKVPTPYVEKIAAMEVQFDFIRKSDGKKIIPTQTFRSYYVKKTGGENGTSHLPKTLKSIIQDTYQKDESLLGNLSAAADKLKLASGDPDEFLAQGGKLKNNPSILLTNLDIKTRLAGQIMTQFLKKITKYTETTELAVASGDAIAVNYLNGNAYEKAINRLSGLNGKGKADLFNLGLAYESIGEALQAHKYYSEALAKDSGNQVYKDAVKRVKR